MKDESNQPVAVSSRAGDARELIADTGRHLRDHEGMCAFQRETCDCKWPRVVRPLLAELKKLHADAARPRVVPSDMDARLDRLGNLVANLAHPRGDHCENPLEAEAHDILRELRANSRSSPVEGQGWQPIVGAPTNNRILVVNKNTQLVSIAWWVENRDGSGFWKSDAGYVYPTHWMPLPNLPALSSPGSRQGVTR